MRTMLMAALALAMTSAAVGQPAARPVVNRVPARYTSPSSGREMFEAYCASCHGRTGKGDGPAAIAMKTGVPDLTLMSKSHGGSFPTEHVWTVIEGQGMLAA